MSSGPSRVALAAAVVTAALAVVAAAWVGGSAPVSARPPLAAALAVVPESATTVGFTHWEAALHGRSLAATRQRDLATRSVIMDLPSDITSPLGVTAKDLEWE